MLLLVLLVLCYYDANLHGMLIVQHVDLQIAITTINTLAG